MDTHNINQKMTELENNSNIIDGVNNSEEEVYKQLVESVTNGKNKITILKLPSEIEKGSPREFKVKQFTEFYLSDEWVSKAKNDNIPYPKEYFLVTKINKNKDGNPTSINIFGSVGGGYNNISWNTPNLIKRIKS